MASVQDTDNFDDDDLDTELDDSSDDDQEVDVDVGDDDEDDEVTADVEDLLRQAAGPSLSARRRVENYLEMKRAARDLSELEDFDFD
jgi:hypothetical protein